MSNLTTPSGKNPAKRKPAPSASNNRHIYMVGPIWTALAEWASVKRTTASTLLTKQAKALLRKNAPLLRKHKITVPPEVFEK